ncbi:putative ion transport protein [Trypoxylus dichotomus]
MILIALELMVVGAQHPHLSTYMIMLRTVAKNFLFFLLWYAILIFAFALGFYVLYNKNGSEQNFTNSTNVEDDNQPFFDELGLTVIKTIVMLTGEFDASSINFNTFWNRIIFLLFVFLNSIVLFNLLNGLAISDIQHIKSEAEILGYAERVSYIVYFESIIHNLKLLLKNSRFLDGLFGNLGFYSITKSLEEKMSLFSNNLPKKMATVKLYDGLVIESEPKPKRYFSKLKCVHIDKKTLKRVTEILQKPAAHNRYISETMEFHRLKTR